MISILQTNKADAQIRINNMYITETFKSHQQINKSY